MDQMQMKEMTDEQLRAMLESIQQELNEREWNVIATKPKNMKRAIKLAQKAKQEHAEGKTIAGGFGKSA
jgi:tRNA C32,U32 (ribose-2'-O)-methylase TrmJ